MRYLNYALAVGVLALVAGCAGGTDNAATSTDTGAMASNAPAEAASATAESSAGSESSDSSTGGHEASSADSSGGEASGDKSAAEKAYDEAEAKLAKNPNDAKLKLAVADAAYEAGRYIEYDKPGLAPREKYRPALKLYRRALELNPDHKEAAKEKEQIENIYTQMGMPIPQ